MSETQRFKRELSEIRNEVYHLLRTVMQSIEYKFDRNDRFSESVQIYTYALSESYRVEAMNRLSTKLICLEKMINDTETMSVEDIMLKLFLSSEFIQRKILWENDFNTTTKIATQELYTQLDDLDFLTSTSKTISDFKKGYLC